MTASISLSVTSFGVHRYAGASQKFSKSAGFFEMGPDVESALVEDR
jgi:hypothetical protein